MNPDPSKPIATDLRNIIPVDFGGAQLPSLSPESSCLEAQDTVPQKSWGELLQTMEAVALDNGFPIDHAEAQTKQCTRVLDDNGYDISGGIDQRFLAQVAKFVSSENSQENSGLLVSVDPNVKHSLLALLNAAGISCSTGQSKEGSSKMPLEGATARSESEPAVSGLNSDLGTLAIVSGGRSTINYALLIGEHAKGRPSVDKKTVQNEISVLRRVLTLLGHTLEAECGWFADESQFDLQLGAVVGVDDRSSRSALNQIRKTFFTLAETSSPANSLWESYTRAHARHVRLGGNLPLLSKKAFIQTLFAATGMPRKRLNAKKISVHGATYDRFQTLEESLGAEGELTQWLINMSDDNREKFRTKYGLRVREAVLFEYALPFEQWPEPAQEEWKLLYLLRTDPLKASNRWGLYLAEVPKKKLYKWRIRKDGSSPSAVKQLRELECFYGWCLKEHATFPDHTKNLWRSGPEETIPRERLSMALVTDPVLFDDYIAFRKAHTLTEDEVRQGTTGRFNGSCKLFIEFTSSLLNPLTGFIYLRKDLFFRPTAQTPDARNLASRVGEEFFDSVLRKPITVTDPDDRWLRWCKKTRSYMEQTREQEFDPTYVTRDQTPIKEILALDDPMEAVSELLAQLDDAEPEHEYWKNFHRRKRFFFRLLSVCPLRIFQCATMTGKHFYKVHPINGAPDYYQIHFTKDEFKNERFIREQDYWFDMPEDLTPFFDSYLQTTWPKLNGRPFSSEDRVFAGKEGSLQKSISQDGKSTISKQSIKPKTAKEKNHRLKTQLQKMCYETTARFLGAKYKTPGFFPHAMRHIKATSIIRVTGSYENAALVLWDHIDTVRENYSHVTRTEQLRKVAREEHARLKRTRLEQLSKAPTAYNK